MSVEKGIERIGIVTGIGFGIVTGIATVIFLVMYVANMEVLNLDWNKARDVFEFLKSWLGFLGALLAGFGVGCFLGYAFCVGMANAVNWVIRGFKE